MYSSVSLQLTIYQAVHAHVTRCCARVCACSDYVLRITEGIEDAGSLRWQLVLCLLMSWIIIFLVLIKGIASLGKVRQACVPW